MKNIKSYSKKALWAGRIISALCVLFLLVDAIMKVIKAMPSVEGSVQLGWPEQYIQSIGIVLLICTILYSVPRTAMLCAILLTGYLGGATAIMVRAAAEGHSFLFPVILGIFVWAGLYLRERKLHALTPIRKQVEEFK